MGKPELEEVLTVDGKPPGPEAPSHVVASIDPSYLTSASLLEESIILTDFGQSTFPGDDLSIQQPVTPTHFTPPEGIFDSRVALSSDVWALACTLFHIRSSWPLFDNFLGIDDVVLKHMVETLGKLPDPYWTSWDARRKWFTETGEPRTAEEQRELMLPAVKTSISERVAEIGDDEEGDNYGRMMDAPGTHLDTAEIYLFTDLLEKMLRYSPRERISMAEVVQHPWFAYGRE